MKCLRDSGMQNSTLQLQSAVASVSTTMKPHFWAVYFALNILRAYAQTTHHVPLGSETTFHWAVKYQEQEVDIELHTKTKEHAEWFAIGFSDYGELKPSDLCVYWVSWKGSQHMRDTWADSSGVISIDTKQDCNNFRYKEKNNTLIIFFTRKFDTCDSEDYIIQDGTTHIVWARGKGPLYNLEGLNLNAASSTGFQRTTLLVNDLPPSTHPSDTWKLDVTTNMVKIPDVETTYWCKVLRLPEKLKRKHHIIEYEPLFKATGDKLVHHMEVFHCATTADQIIPEYEGSCHAEDRPETTKVCSKVLAAWAMGALPFSYPKEAGSPIGGPDFNLYVMLEIHYHNPSIVSGSVDSSGFRLYVTPSLRAHDAGIMELGLEYNDKMAIPPEQERFQLSGYCIHACTAVGLPKKGITVFGSQLHTHLTGRRVWTKHVRNGVELLELNRDNHYSQHFQEIRRLKRPVKILPGDALITTCEYSTLDRVNVTLTGFSITEEMCVNYIHYYPRAELEVCKSSIPTIHLQDYFESINTLEEQKTSRNSGISDNYKAIIWNPLRVKNLNQLYMNSPLSMQCNQSSGARFPGGWEDLPQTRIYLHQPQKQRRCPYIY